MDEDELRKRLAAATGEAMFAGLLVGALWRMLRVNGAVSKEQSIETIDRLLLIIEKNRQATQGDLAAIDHARSRLEGLLASHSEPPHQDR